MGAGGDNPVWRELYKPKPICCWRVELWAKRGKLMHTNVVKCEEPMDIDTFVKEHLGEITDEFMSTFARVVEDRLVALKLEGKYADAYAIESKTPRFGYKGYEE